LFTIRQYTTFSRRSHYIYTTGVMTSHAPLTATSVDTWLTAALSCRLVTVLILRAAHIALTRYQHIHTHIHATSAWKLVKKNWWVRCQSVWNFAQGL